MRCIFCGSQCSTDCLPRHRSHYTCHNQQCPARAPDPEATNAMQPEAQNPVSPRPAPRNLDPGLPRTPGSGYSSRHHPRATVQHGTNRGATSAAPQVSVSPLSSSTGSEPRRPVSPCSPPASPARSYSSVRRETGRIDGGSRPGPNPTDNRAEPPRTGQPNQLRRRPAFRSRPGARDETRDQDPHGREGGGSRSNDLPRGGGDGSAGGTGVGRRRR